MSATLATMSKFAQYLPQLKQGYDWLSGSIPGAKDSRSSMENKYTNWLQSRRVHGLGQQNINQMMNQTGTTVTNAANQGKAQVQGRAISQGIENSGVAAEQATEIDSAQVVSMANAARKIAMKNQQVKDNAEHKLGEIGMQRSAQDYKTALASYSKKDNAANQLLGALAGMGDKYLKKQEDAGLLEELQKQPWWSSLSPEEKAKILGGI
tara:strand:+ start:703 stop:1329 length:627 start_codon:yes stop_codon:yes gene_type:complete